MSPGHVPALSLQHTRRRQRRAGAGSSRGRARLWASLREIPELRPAVPPAPRALRNRAGTWWGGGTESEELRRAAPLKQGSPELDVPLGGGWRRSVHRCGGCRARLGAAPRLSPVRCGTAAATGACPRRGLRPSRAQRGLPRGRGSAAEPPPPQEPQDAGRQRWEVCRIPHFGGKQERKHPIKPQNPRGVPVAPAPPRTETPNLPGTTESRGCRHLLTCRPRVCCYPAPALPLFLSSSPPSSSSSSLPLPAAWGSLWRFIHSCLPIGPSAFPCLPEAERVTPRPFPATFRCHRAALPQPQGAAGPGHAWAAQVVGASPREGWG